MNDNSTLLMGVIVKAQGIKGEVKIKPFTDTPDVLCCLDYVLIDGIEYDVIKSRCDNTMAYMLLEGINDRNMAESFRLKDIYVNKTDAPTPRKGRYYISDIMGCEVFTDTNELLGKISDVIQSGSSDVYVISLKGKDILVPVLSTLIVKVDIYSKTIIMSKEKLKEVAVYDS